MSGPAATSRILPFISNTPTVPVHGQVVEAVGAGVRPPLIGPPGGASAGRPRWTWQTTMRNACVMEPADEQVPGSATVSGRRRVCGVPLDDGGRSRKG